MRLLGPEACVCTPRFNSKNWDIHVFGLDGTTVTNAQFHINICTYMY